jgi:hypothetical protein
MADRALADVQALRASQGHILADRRDGVGDRLGDRAAARIMGAEHGFGVDIRGLVERDRQDAAHQRLKVIIAGDEVGLRIDLRDDAEIGLDRDSHEAFGGHAAALFGRFGKTLLAQPVDRRLDVAVGLVERVLAVHHARAGLIAQILDQPGGDRRHRFPSCSRRGVPQEKRRRDFSLKRPPSLGRLSVRPRRSRIFQQPSPQSAAINARACSLHLSRAMRPLNFRSESSLAASAVVMAASCQ